eukprot:14330034-Heterocapsa_arctica.AAC.1
MLNLILTSKVINEIIRIENNIANTKRSNDEQGADKHAKLATHIEVNKSQKVNNNKQMAEVSKKMPNIFNLLGINNIKNGEQMLDDKHKVGNANKPHVQRTILKSRN